MKTKHIVRAVLNAVIKVIIAIVVVMLFYKGATAAYNYGYSIFAEPALAQGEGRTVEVAITDGMTSEKMGEMLVAKGLIRDAKLFKIQFMVSEFKDSIVPGVYKLSTAMTAEEMLEVMSGS